VYAMMSPASGLFDYSNKFCHANLPVWGMWVYLGATTFLGELDSLLLFLSDFFFPFFRVVRAALNSVVATLAQ